MMDKIRLILTSHSIDNTFDSCPRKFEFLNIYDRRPPRESGYAANVGTALHECVQQFLISMAEGRSKEESMQDGYLKLMMFFPWWEEDQQSTRVRDFNHVSAMAEELMLFNEWDEWELVRVEGRGWAIEVPFLIRHTSIGIFTLKATGEQAMLATQGKIDFVLRHKRTGKIRGWDLKTTSISRDLVPSEFMWSGQQVGYNEVIRAVTHNPDEDFEIFYLIAAFAVNDPAYVEAIPMIKSQDDIDDYWLNKLDRLQRMKRYAEEGRFPRRNGGCNSYQHECSCFRICPSRDTELILEWFSSVGAVEQVGYEPWIEMEL